MVLSNSTKELLSAVSEASGNRLQRSMDLARLIELAQVNSLQDQLDDLAFAAKFLSKSFDLMKRVGKEGEGYDKLFEEFSTNIQKSQRLIGELTGSAESTVKSYFSECYLSMSDNTMNNLMQLFHDLSWYKNYKIDSRT
ncbi:MAG: hypothetical protein WCT99_06660 [Bacteroidota bacterium]